VKIRVFPTAYPGLPDESMPPEFELLRNIRAKRPSWDETLAPFLKPRDESIVKTEGSEETKPKTHEYR